MLAPALQALLNGLNREAEEIDHLVAGCAGVWEELRRLAAVQASREASELKRALDAAMVEVAEGVKELELIREDARLAAVHASREVSELKRALDAAMVEVAEGVKELELIREEACASEKDVVMQREERERSLKRERAQRQDSRDREGRKRMDEIAMTKGTLTGLVCELSLLREEQKAMRVTREREYIDQLAEAERMGKIVAALRTEVSCALFVCLCVSVCLCVLHARKHACLYAYMNECIKSYHTYIHTCLD